MQGIVGRAWASFRKFITSLTLIVEPTEPQQRTDTRMRLLRIGATQPDASDGTWSVSHVHVHVHGSLTEHVWTLVLVGRHVRTRACCERQETRSDWMSCTLLKITGNYYCIVHRYECTQRQRSRSCELSIFLKFKVDPVPDWKETRSDRTSCTFCWPEISGPCIGMRATGAAP